MCMSIAELKAALLMRNVALRDLGFSLARSDGAELAF